MRDESLSEVSLLALASQSFGKDARGHRVKVLDFPEPRPRGIGILRIKHPARTHRRVVVNLAFSYPV